MSQRNVYCRVPLFNFLHPKKNNRAIFFKEKGENGFWALTFELKDCKICMWYYAANIRLCFVRELCRQKHCEAQVRWIDWEGWVLDVTQEVCSHRLPAAIFTQLDKFDWIVNPCWLYTYLYLCEYMCKAYVCTGLSETEVKSKWSKWKFVSKVSIVNAAMILIFKWTWIRFWTILYSRDF